MVHHAPKSHPRLTRFNRPRHPGTQKSKIDCSSIVNHSRPELSLLASGTAQLRARFALRFQKPNLHAHLINRIVMGQFVIDHERVTRTFPEGTGSIELIATYEVVDGRIINAWFLAGPKTLDPQ